MAVSDRTRKILWVRAGGRCSICRDQLVTEGTDTDDPSVFGEEAHIIGQSPNGPRAGHCADVDGHENLILLCRRHHKQIDDQVEYFTVDRLREIKIAHEAWIAKLGDPSRLRFRQDGARPDAANAAISEALVDRQRAVALR
jgi:hypothetical protein